MTGDRVPRRATAAVAAVAALALGLAGLGIVPSEASWADREFVHSPLAAMDCTTGAPVNSTSWARVLSGTVSGQTLDGVAAVRGLTVANLAPATTSSASGASPATSLGADAWSSALDLTALNGLSIGAGVILPFGSDTGAYTQWARDTALGLSAAAAGAVTSAAGGAASLGNPSGTPPQLADLTLSSLLDAVLAGGGVGATTAQLSDVHLKVGAIAALASLDSCGVLWSGTAPGSALTRQYLVNGLSLEFTSSVVKGLGTTIDSTLATLQTTLNGIAAPGTSVTGSALSAVASTLGSVLNLTIAGSTISLGRIDSLTVGAVFDLTAARALLAQDIVDGPVTVNLSTGRVVVDLAAVFGQVHGTSGLNGLGPNASVLTPAVLSAVSTDVGDAVSRLLTGAVTTALTKAVDDASVTITLATHLNATVPLVGTPLPNLLALNSTITGTVGGFTGVAGYPAPAATTTVSDLSGLLGSILTALTSGLTNAIATGLVPTLGASVVQPLVKSVALTTIGNVVAGLTGTTVPAAVTTLSGVLGVLGTLVAVTVNAQPDQPDPVGPPDAAAAGRWFETALQVGVVDGSGAPLAALYLASASVGPNGKR